MAYGKTYLQLVNDVLARLREPSASSVTANTYSTLIGKFVNEAKREVEDAWDWNRLRTTIQINTMNGTNSYAVAGAGKRFRVLDVINDSSDVRMRPIPQVHMNTFLHLGTTQIGEPVWYRFNGYDSNGDPNVNLYPTPDAAYTLRFDLVIPQAEFTSDSDQLIVQETPVILGAWAKAISERGEDGGQNTSEAFELYRFALSDAIAQDAGLAQDELVWRS